MIEHADRTKRHGLLINITGDGKGKTSSALGTFLRALGRNWNVAVIQFIKNDSDTGERHFAAASGLPFEIFSMGTGFAWRKNGSPDQDIQCAENAWRKVVECIAGEQTDLLALDELNIALDKIIAGLRARPHWMHVIITGRNALPQLIEVSDLVSEIREVKHPFSAGIPAQQGIEF
ncbi:MAG: cob(I)yrinic acid a,c-diamide adenosyltransferase [Victivallaceae bacterium]